MHRLQESVQTGSLRHTFWPNEEADALVTVAILTFAAPLIRLFKLLLQNPETSRPLYSTGLAKFVSAAAGLATFRF